MPPKRQIYLLDPKQLSPETIAVTFAKTSRSPQSFREIAAELSDEKSSDFHEKWVVGYGHASVAEHAVLHLAIENVSRLAVETLESNRLASYTEKSSRYQVWSADHFILPPELENHPLKEAYLQTCRDLFSAYEHALPELISTAEGEYFRLAEESESVWQRRVHAQAVDVGRYYLPASALANVGMTINARALEHAICKMLSHPLREVREIGDEVKTVAQSKAPTLVKYANENPCLIEAQHDFYEQFKDLPHLQNSSEWCRITTYDPHGERRVLAALLFRFSKHDFFQCVNTVNEMTDSQRKNITNTLLGKLRPHDIPLRELEHASLTIDLVLDQGAYGEIKRHRMMTQTPQRFTPLHGYAIPKLITKAGLETSFNELMQQAHRVHNQIADFNHDAAAYVLPNAYKRRVLLTMNLRSAYHMIKLRTALNAHFAMRRAACRLAEEIQKIYPLFAPYFSSMSAETSLAVENQYFTKP